MRDFFSFVADFKSVVGLIGKAALIAPFATLLLNIGPPWPGKTSVPALTSLCEVLVLMYVFQFHASLSKKRLNARLRQFFLAVVGTFVVYVFLYSFFVIDIPLDSTRDVSGFVVQPRVTQLLTAPGATIDTVLEGMEWDPFRVWEPWTIRVMRVSLLLVWIVFFIGIAGCIAAFAALQRRRTAPVVGRAVPPKRQSASLATGSAESSD